jgi:hypothetical protein
MSHFGYFINIFCWQCEQNNVHEDLRQLSYGIVSARSYGRYDVNGFRFRSTKFEADHPLAATSNVGVLARTMDTTYYGIINDILEFDFAGNKNLKVIFFDCDWFHPNTGTRENRFGMVEVKHRERLRGYDTFVLAHQVDQVYYVKYPCPIFEAWWVVFRVKSHQQLLVPSAADYHETELGEGVDQIYQDDELPSFFNVETEILQDSLVADRDDVVVMTKRKRVSRKKKVTWHPLRRRKPHDPDYEYD